MPATISENYLSRPFTAGRTSGRELIYDVVGTDDEAEVETLIRGQIPSLYRGLLLEEISAEPQGGGVWKGYARYAGLDADSEFTFDTSGGTQKITQALETIANYAPPGMTAPNFQGAIGVSEDRVEGVDIIVPTFEFTETHRFLDPIITPAYKLTLAELTGRYNDAIFKGFAAGTVLFLGAQGGKRGDELWAITYRFGFNPNITNQTLGAITGINKLGWDYLWVRYADYEDDTAFALVKQAASVHVERVYFPGNFADLGIGV